MHLLSAQQFDRVREILSKAPTQALQLENFDVENASGLVEIVHRMVNVSRSAKPGKTFRRSIRGGMFMKKSFAVIVAGLLSPASPSDKPSPPRRSHARSNQSQNRPRRSQPAMSRASFPAPSGEAILSRC